MFIAEIRCAIWNDEGHSICDEPGCGVHDGTVAACDWCGSQVCTEHDDVLMNRDIDSGLMLCQSCGDDFDKHNGIVFDDDGRPLIYGPPHGRDAELLRPQPWPPPRIHNNPSSF